MTLEIKPDIKKYSNILVFSISLIPVILFLYIIWNRSGLPFVFEWGESAGVNQINHILKGFKLYGPPSIEFTPLVYTPIYYYLAAGLSFLIGNSIFAARIISIASTLGSVFLIGRIVRNETGNTLIAWISGIFYLACFSLSDGFYDLIRVDSLYILFVLIAFIIVQEAKNRSGYVIFGVLLIIGFFIKQSFLIVFIPLQAYLLIKEFRLSWSGMAVYIVGLAGLLLLINGVSDNWFFYYIFGLPREHGYSLISAFNFWIGDTIRPLGILFVFSLFYLLKSKLISREITPDTKDCSPNDLAILEAESRHRWWVHILFLAGAGGAAWVTRSSNGGGANNCMLIYAALAISFGLVAGLLFNTKWVKDNQWLYAFITLVITIQFVGLIYNPFNFLPTNDEIKANENIADRIRDADKPVLIPYRSHLSEELDHGPQIHMVNLFELTGYFKGEILPAGIDLVDQIREEVCHQSYGLIILDQPVPWIGKQIDLAYEIELVNKDSDFQQSHLLDWQQWNIGSYLPKDNYDLDGCLGSVSSKKD